MDLNQQKLVTQGPKGITVQYSFTDSLVHSGPTPMRLLFTPFFDEQEKISNMSLEFSYSGWAPWNKHLQSDSLIGNVKKLAMAWYKGNEFIMASVGGKDVPVKLDGNRRVTAYTLDAQSVVLEVQDILHPKFSHSIPFKEKPKQE